MDMNRPLCAVIPYSTWNSLSRRTYIRSNKAGEAARLALCTTFASAHSVAEIERTQHMNA